MVLSVVILASLAAVLLTGGFPQLVFAGLVGALVTVALVGWLVGGHARSLAWAWGAAGERDTATMLEALTDAWICVHDLPRERGNWDHVLVGPPGVLLLDTKVLTAPARVLNDALRAGRQVMPGASLRGAAAGLAEALADRGRRPWVQPVMVVWGAFEQGLHEERGVVYVHGSELLGWLSALPERTSAPQRRELARRVEALASGTAEPGEKGRAPQ